MLEALNSELAASHKLQLTKQTVSQAASQAVSLRAQRYPRTLMKPLPNQQVHRQQLTHCSRAQVYLKGQTYLNRATRISITS